jgi:hypothetical protein
MKIPVSASLLKFLINHGYTHCFSKTQYGADYSVSLLLTPVQPNKPMVKYIPAKLDAFFAIQDELIRLLNNKQTIWISMRPDMIKGVAGSLLNAYLISKSNEACINY